MSDLKEIKDIPKGPGLIVPVRSHYDIALECGGEQVQIGLHHIKGGQVYLRISANKRVEILGAHVFAKLDAQKEEIYRLKSHLNSLEIQSGVGKLQ